MILIGVSNEGDTYGISPRMANRHGLISGATGTGKTITLRTIAENLSKEGVPVFLADMKGDLSGISLCGEGDRFQDRAEQLGVNDFKYRSYPCCYWDIYEESGLPIRATLESVSPVLLSRMLNLTRVQQGVLDLVYQIAEDNHFKLNTLQDLKGVLKYVGGSTEELFEEYGTIYPSSLGAILRAVIGLEQQGGDKFFGNETLDLKGLMQLSEGMGVINIMECAKLVRHPVMYSTFIIWLLDRLYNELPEVGDCDKPKLVLFFDEAHLLFEDAPKSITNKVSQIIRLIRSKGVGIYFISQSPSDIPDKVLSQLSNRVQHSLRAYTPNELKAVKAAALSFRPNPKFDTEELIVSLGVGEALVSFLDDSGIPQVVDLVNIVPPESNLKVLSNNERKQYNALYNAQKHLFFKSNNNKWYIDIPKIKKPVKTENKRSYSTTHYTLNTAKSNNDRSGVGLIAEGLLRGILMNLK